MNVDSGGHLLIFMSIIMVLVHRLISRRLKNCKGGIILLKALWFLFRFLEVNSTELITEEFAIYCRRKAVFSYVLYMSSNC